MISMKTSIGVVGATGTVGSELVTLLANKENALTYALVRDLNKFKNMNVSNAEFKYFDFSI